MEPVIEIPAPSPRDSETVVTALETAAVFSAKGDTAEALRWLQRAAESAGDDGDDQRTLTLARTAADLSRALQPAHGAAPLAQVGSDQLTPTHSRRLPRPPPRLGSTQPELEESEGAASFGGRAHAPPPSQSRNPRPPPPSSARPASAPSSSRAAYSASASSRSLPSRSPAQPAASSTPRYLEMRSNESSDSEAEESQRLTQPLPAPRTDSVRTSKLRLAARVSVVPSPTEPGLFLVRLLEDGAAAPSNVAEALLVLVDPNSTVLLG
jgi:hypothetical protein